MKFTFETEYNQAAMTAMARGLRKTTRKKRSKRSVVLGVLVIILGLALTLTPGENGITVDFRSVFTWAVLAVMVLVLLFQDRINGALARRRMLPGMDKASTVFTPEHHTSTTALGQTQWTYEGILAIAETKDYFVFLLSQNHAQVYDKRTLSGGTVEDFRRFIQDMTQKEVQKV